MGKNLNGSSSIDHQIPSPANETKEVEQLYYPLPKLDCSFNLVQVAGNGSTTGSTLWLSSQILACYLQCQQKGKYDVRKEEGKEKKTVLELGAGIGLSSLVLERLGWNVISTDIEPPLCTVLQPNIQKNGQGKIKVQKLDWNSFAIESLENTIDLIVTADTIYQPSLVTGLFKTITQILKKSSDSFDNKIKKEKQNRLQNRPHALIALERRDHEQIEKALECATKDHQLQLKRIPQRELRKAVDQCFGSDEQWPRNVWEDVEIWRVDFLFESGEEEKKMK